MEQPPPNEPEPQKYPGMPRWVRISLIAILVIVLVVFVAGTLLGGEHGPSRHLPAIDPAGARAFFTLLECG